MAPSNKRRQGKVREIDFRRPSKFPREHIRRLEAGHENFCRSTSSRLSAELRSPLQLEVIGTDQLPFTTVMSEEVPPQALVTVLTVEPLGTEVALIMDLQLALCFVDRLLGGNGTPHSATATGLSDIELAVAKRAIGTFVEMLSATWIDLAEVTFSIAGMSTSPLSVQIVPPSEPTLLLNMSAMIDDQIAIITLLLPHRSVEGILHKLEHAAFGPAAIDGSGQAELRRNMGGVHVQLRAEVGGVPMSLERALTLQPGDVVELGRPAQDGVTIFVGEIPSYQAAPGRNGKLRAVQVLEALEVDE